MASKPTTTAADRADQDNLASTDSGHIVVASAVCDDLLRAKVGQKACPAETDTDEVITRGLAGASRRSHLFGRRNENRSGMPGYPPQTEAPLEPLPATDDGATRRQWLKRSVTVLGGAALVSVGHAQSAQAAPLTFVDLSSNQTIKGIKTLIDPLAFPAASSGSGKGMKFATSVVGQNHVIGVNQQPFNGVIDNVLTLAVNGIIGSPGVKAAAAENFLQLGLESRWLDGLGRDQAEFNLDYINRDSTHTMRPLSWYADTTTHDNGWAFAGTHFSYSSDTVSNVLNLTNAGADLHGFRLAGRALGGLGFDWPTFQSRNAMAPTELSVMPKGNPSGERAGLIAWGSDFLDDAVNYQRLAIYAWSDGGADLVTEKGGTGVAGSICFHSGRKLEIKTDGKVVMGNKLTMAGQSAGTIDVIDNTTSSFYTRLNAQNGTFRLFGGSHLGLLDASSATGIDLYHDGTAAAVDTLSVTPLSLRIKAVEHARISAGADGETSLMVRRDIGGSLSLQRVSIGAADSGGAGFRVLRVPN
jgi:hypothetical protein